MSSVSTPPHTPRNKRTRVRSVQSINRGDHIEVSSGDTVYYRGEVRETAPGLGTVWIREDEGVRTAISVDDFSIWKTSD